MGQVPRSFCYATFLPCSLTRTRPMHFLHRYFYDVIYIQRQRQKLLTIVLLPTLIVFSCLVQPNPEDPLTLAVAARLVLRGQFSICFTGLGRFFLSFLLDEEFSSFFLLRRDLSPLLMAEYRPLTATSLRLSLVSAEPIYSCLRPMNSNNNDKNS